MNAYGIAWTVGVGLGLGAAAFSLHRRGLTSWRAAATVVLAFFTFFVGAKLQYRMESLDASEALRTLPGELFEPGLRLPLGLVGALLAGMATAWRLAVPWRIVADALAMGACIAIAVGRWGCFIHGCCSGSVCVMDWPWCISYPPVTEPHGLQVMRGMIESHDTRSLPVHPLPLYYSVTQVGILAVLLVRGRNRNSGEIFWIVAACSALSRLLFEPLRAAAAGPLMLWIPLGVLAGASAMMLAGWATAADRVIRGRASDEQGIRLRT